MRITTQLAVFFVAFNLFGGMLIGLGVADDLGINLDTGDPAAIDKVEEKATDDEKVGLGNAVGGTLFGMYNALTRQFGLLVNTIAPGFAMLKLFVPSAIIDPFAIIAGMITLVDLLSYARGFDL